MSHRYRNPSTNFSYEETPHFPADQGVTEPRKRTGIVKNSPNVNLRESADKKSKSLSILKEGTKVEILDNGIETNGFKRVIVKDKNLEGYIVSKFCIGIKND